MILYRRSLRRLLASTKGQNTELEAKKWPTVREPDFAERIRELHAKGEINNTEAERVLALPNVSSELRFSALYYLLFRAERSNDITRYEQLCHMYREEFLHNPYYGTFLATVLRNKGGVSNLRSALVHCGDAVQSLSDRPGVRHQYASICADLLDLLDETDQEILVKAQESVDVAISNSLKNNSNYHATKARLLAHSGDFEGALSEVQVALELEDTNSADSMRRVARFESIRSLIRTRRSESIFQAKVLESRHSLESMRAEQMQQLGLLAAVVALIMVTASASNRVVSEASAIRSVLVLLGAVSIVFSTLFYAAQKNVSSRRLILPIVTSSLLIILALLLPSEN